jgi:hypothetical protein
MGEWEFCRVAGSAVDDAPFLWSWRCRQEDGTVMTSSESFRFFLDCVAHARLHGYSNGPLLTRREPPFAAGAALRGASLDGALPAT